MTAAFQIDDRILNFILRIYECTLGTYYVHISAYPVHASAHRVHKTNSKLFFNKSLYDKARQSWLVKIRHSAIAIRVFRFLLRRLIACERRKQFCAKVYGGEEVFAEFAVSCGDTRELLEPIE